MANTQKYLNHLLQNTGITPACSEEERAAANIVADIFKRHGFEPEIQEFTASSSAKMALAAEGLMVFVGAVLLGIGGPVGAIGMVLAFAGCILFAMEKSGRPVLSNMGRGGISQNVIAYHKASGPLASPRNRPVVVVAHLDSPRADLLAQAPYAAYRPLLAKLLPVAMFAPAVLSLVRLMPLPAAVKALLWIAAIACALVPLAQAAAIIANKFVLPYTSGSVCNKSSLAAMLGVMDAVAPFQGANEFPSDVPFEDFMAEQQRIAASMVPEPLSAEEVYSDFDDVAVEEDDEIEQQEQDDVSAPADQTSAMPAVAADATSAMPVVQDDATSAMPAVDESDMEPSVVDGVNEDASEEPVADEVSETCEADVPQGDEEDATEGSVGVEEAPVAEFMLPVNVDGNIRYGTDVIRALGMVPASCAFSYDDDALPVVSEPILDAEGDVSEAAADGDAELEAMDTFDNPSEDACGQEEAASNFEEEADVESWGDLTGDDSDEDGIPVEELEPEEIDDYVLEAEYEVIEDEPASECDDMGATTTFDAIEDDSDLTVEQPAGNGEDQLCEEPVEEVVAEKEASETDEDHSDEEQVVSEGTQVFEAVGQEDLSGKTQAMPALAPERPVETVDSLMAQIAQPSLQARSQRTINLPSTASPAQQPAPRRVPNVPGIEAFPQAPVVNRTPLFDLPDPSVTPSDPFAMPAAPSSPSPASRGFSVVDGPMAAAPAPMPVMEEEVFETISAPAPEVEKPRRGLGKLFGRKKKQQDSMSEWLGVDSDFDAKRNGGAIGSWDNFDDDFDGGWKGGATGAEGVSDDDLRDAITAMGDDELLGHDIWFVATGASECGNAGINAFLDTHREFLRGVFLINLESVGSGQVAVLATEGADRVLKGDRRIMHLVQRVSADFHNEFGSVEMPFLATDAYAAMNRSLRSLTIAGVDSSHLSCSHTEEDQPFNVDEDNVRRVADVVTEVIRRS